MIKTYGIKSCIVFYRDVAFVDISISNKITFVFFKQIYFNTNLIEQ